MAGKRKRRSSLPKHPKPNKKLQSHKEKTKQDENPNPAGNDNNFPELVINKILLQVPTKVAFRASTVSKQWADVCFSIPALDLDEGDPCDDTGRLIKPQRTNFFNFVKAWMKRREKDKYLDKFKLRMLFTGGNIRVDKWLRFALERSVKVLDLSFPPTTRSWSGYYKLPHNILAAKFITTLSLEYVRMNDISTNHCLSLPSLKTMSLKDVRLRDWALSKLISGCPFLESLSLTSCAFRELKIFSPSLASLEVKECRSRYILIDAMSLGSFTFISKHRHLDSITLFDCRSLKYINVHGEHLKYLQLYGCLQASVEATIHAPKVESFDFSGYLKANVSMKAPKTTLLLLDGSPTFKWSSKDSKHFSNLRAYLQNFGSSQTIKLYIFNPEVFMFPKNFRKRCSVVPLPELKHLNVFILTSPAKERDSGLKDSLCWMAPSLETLSIEYLEAKDF